MPLLNTMLHKINRERDTWVVFQYQESMETIPISSRHIDGSKKIYNFCLESTILSMY